MSKLFKTSALTLMVIVIFTLSLELWSIIVDLSSSLPSKPGYCWGSMYLRILSFLLLDSTMFLFYMVRISHIFAQSAFYLSKKFLYSIYVSIPTIVLILMITLAIVMNPSYHHEMGCIIEIDSKIQVILIISQLFSFLLNIIYGIIFYRKLSEYQFICATAIAASAREGRPNALNILMQKHTFLALFSLISSIIAYIIFNLLILTATSINAFQYGFFLIDIDMIIKSILMLLMFNIYTSRFFQFCWCCIRISAIDCTKCCTYCCSVLDSSDFNEQKPLFTKLSTINVLSNEDMDILTTESDKLDTSQYNAKHLDTSLGSEFYAIKKIKYKYFVLLVKNNRRNKIYQFSVNDHENIPNEESVFKQISRVKAKKQDITRYKNEQEEYGNIIDTNKSHANLSKVNIYFRKSKTTKYPFIVAIKCNSSIEDGNIISNYIKKRIEIEQDLKQNNNNNNDNFEYEPLLRGIASELRHKTLDKNILYKRMHLNKPKRRLSLKTINEEKKENNNYKRNSKRLSINLDKISAKGYKNVAPISPDTPVDTPGDGSTPVDGNGLRSSITSAYSMIVKAQNRAKIQEEEETKLKLLEQKVQNDNAAPKPKDDIFNTKLLNDNFIRKRMHKMMDEMKLPINARRNMMILDKDTKINMLQQHVLNKHNKDDKDGVKTDKKRTKSVEKNNKNNKKIIKGKSSRADSLNAISSVDVKLKLEKLKIRNNKNNKNKNKNKQSARAKSLTPMTKKERDKKIKKIKDKKDKSADKTDKTDKTK